jgi:hypothetical protein
VLGAEGVGEEDVGGTEAVVVEALTSGETVTEAVDVVEEGVAAASDVGTTGVVAGVELAGARREPGPEFAGVSVVGRMAAPFKLNEFSIISRVVRKFRNGWDCKSYVMWKTALPQASQACIRSAE